MSSGHVHTAAGVLRSGRAREFAGEVFAPLRRAEQHRWARAYLSGLLAAPERKTPQNLARAARAGAGAAHGLRQFVNASPWDWTSVRRALAAHVAAATVPYAWTVAELCIPKRGEHSVGARRRVDPLSGRLVNCQLALGLFLLTAAGCLPVAWSLVLDGVWAHDRERRLRARVPDGEAAGSADVHLLGLMAATAADPALPRLPWTLDLTREGDIGGLLAALNRHTDDLVCKVGPRQTVLRGNQPGATTVRALVEERGALRMPAQAQDAAGEGHWPAVHTCPGRVRVPSLRSAARQDTADYQVLALADPASGHPSRYWITAASGRDLERLLPGLGGRPCVNHAVAALKERFGVLDFEGRSFPGWHRHMTMVSAAYAYWCLYEGPEPGSGRAPGNGDAALPPAGTPDGS